MNKLGGKITIKVNKHSYLKDPDSSELGLKIVKASIELIDKIGFEEFTFKKLAVKIKSAEASIYRYFESKHQLLSYLVQWYWGWQEYRLLLRLVNISNAQKRLRLAIEVLTGVIKDDSTFSQINEVKLNRIVISESSKVYFSRKVDADNALGFFTQYKELVQLVANVILEINSKYKYPHMLVSTVIESAHHQRFFAQHLPRLTDTVKGEDAIVKFYQELVLKEIQ